MVEVKRALSITLPQGRSAFLWGPRKSGKTTLLNQVFAESKRYDLLETDTYFRLSKEPFRLREELNVTGAHTGKPVVIDEIQKIPALLDEVHWLMENRRTSFVLCGSSARKLKKSHANMLGGRAWRFELYPLTYNELGGHFDLLTALNRGLLPPHYFDDQHKRTLKSYVADYLKEEILQEGLVRNLPSFARFLDSVPFSNGELVNYSNISRECAVSLKTVANYYQILVDTLLGHFVQPFAKPSRRQTITSTPKFYLFDVGVANFLAGTEISQERGREFGRSFEHFIFMELAAYRAYSEKEFEICFWRTKEGTEVDFVLKGGEVAVEVKGGINIGRPELTGINAFLDSFHPKRAIVVCNEQVRRKLDRGIEIVPWKEFLTELWAGGILA
jgi:predicted AAA+ superfamily ATPase